MQLPTRNSRRAQELQLLYSYDERVTVVEEVVHGENDLVPSRLARRSVGERSRVFYLHDVDGVWMMTEAASVIL